MTAAPLPAPAPGDAVGRYRLGEPLGAGGAGAVFATWGAAGEPLAIKVIALAADPTMQARARREVDALARLAHPNVLGLVDAGQDAGRAWLVTPRLPGITLREALAGGPMSPEAAGLIVHFAAAGAGAIHAAGLVHRDLKPDNLMLTDDGRVVVIDLGLALAPDWTRQTSEGAVAGSLPYMAPEQIEGAAGPASDVWALAVTLWELATGARPFARSRATEEVAAILAGARPRFVDAERRASPELADLVERCLGPLPARPPTGAALAGALADVIAPALDGAPPGRALAALRADRPGFEAAVRARVGRQAVARAVALAGAGDPFVAMRAIDRALAYAPDEPALQDALARAIPVAAPASPPAPAAVAHPTPLPAPARRRRWPYLVAGAGMIGAAGITAALLARRGDAPYRVDHTRPDKVLEALAVAARTGDASFLPDLCYPGLGDGDVRDVCAAQPNTPGWYGFVEAFAELRVDGVQLTGKGAVVAFGFGPGGYRREEMRMVRVDGRYYLESF